MPVIIRSATPADLPAILDITNEAILHTTAIYDYAPRSMAAQEAWWQDKQATGMPVIVAELEGQTIGFGSYGRFRPKEGYKYSVEHSIYLAAHYRGQGIGSTLLRELMALAVAQGLHTMVAGIDAANESSIAFHKKYGFVEVGRLPQVGFKFERWLDLVFLQKIL
ncbi:phosphinothricin acetyltransferase [Chitinophaga costaii]|uniref:Phosphinothricin acetyltransferase n=1 Tax=Chitinophaga costaii TaxID=1335309 RepID=A0A1C4E9J1_9BACT|nr:GNAT family N-acetyltransferase [Chitinophaga costaii]PUZ24397.1 N-acetyltransferase [Chitinophaga costaii]SCC40142.1 phosphinothricin acetyltransferase [Chitinophaga costaii]